MGVSEVIIRRFPKAANRRDPTDGSYEVNDGRTAPVSQGTKQASGVAMVVAYGRLFGRFLRRDFLCTDLLAVTRILPPRWRSYSFS